MTSTLTCDQQIGGDVDDQPSRVKGTAIESSQDFAHAIDLLGVHDSPPHRSLVGPLLIAGQDADYMRGALCVAEILAQSLGARSEAAITRSAPSAARESPPRGGCGSGA